MSIHSAKEWRQYILTRGVFGNALKFSHLEVLLIDSHFFDTGFDTECDLIRALIEGGGLLDCPPNKRFGAVCHRKNSPH